MTDCPSCQQTAGNRQPLGIYVAFRDHEINAAHQVVEIVTGVTGPQQMSELLAVTGGAAWIGAEYHESAGGEDLGAQAELNAAHGARAVPHVEEQRILCGSVEPRRLQHPGLNGSTVRWIADLLRGSDLPFVQQTSIGRGQGDRLRDDVGGGWDALAGFRRRAAHASGAGG